MKRLSILPCLAVLLAGCASNPQNSVGDDVWAAPGSVALGAGTASSGDLSVVYGNAFAAPGRPGVALGFVATPDGAEHLSHLLVFDHALPEGAVASRGTSDGAAASSFYSFVTPASSCQVEYRVVLDPVTKDVVHEAVLAQREAFELDAGQVFLVSVLSDPPTVTQVPLQVPADRVAERSAVGGEDLARTLLDWARRNDASVDAFCTRIENGGE